MANAKRRRDAVALLLLYFFGPRSEAAALAFVTALFFLTVSALTG